MFCGLTLAPPALLCHSGYYGWHPSGVVSDKVIQAAARNWQVPVALGTTGYTYMAHPNPYWAGVHVTLLVLLALVLLMGLRNFLFGLL
jgi:hypothetical protein